MGNSHGGGFRRGTGTLGLSKSELESRCKPSGLYETNPWEDKVVRRLIGDGKLAARLVGSEDRSPNSTDQECPICFLNYAQINVVKCCKATICTECYLQVEDPRKDKYSPCPFCNHPKMVVSVAKKLEKEDVVKREEEEQRVIEATIRARANSVSKSLTADNNGEEGGENEEFGSTLNKTLRKRTMSGSGSNNEITSSSQLDSPLVLNESAVVTPEERERLINEMRSQTNHPLLQQMRNEQDSQRERHDREYDQLTEERFSRFQRDFMLRHNRDLDSLRRLERITSPDVGGSGGDGSEDSSSGGSGNRSRRFRGPRSLNSRRGGRSTGNSGDGGILNDWFLIEAALLLSMQQRIRTAAGNSENNNNNSNNNENAESSNDGDGEGENPTNPLLHTLTTQSDDAGGSESEEELFDHEQLMNLRRATMRHDEITNPLYESDFLGRGVVPMVSEEEQMAMAIAMSLREAEAERERNRRQSEEEIAAAADAEADENNDNNNDDVNDTTTSTNQNEDLGLSSESS